MGERWSNDDEQRTRAAEDRWQTGDRAAVEDLEPLHRAVALYRLGYGTSGLLDDLDACQRSLGSIVRGS